MWMMQLPPQSPNRWFGRRSTEMAEHPLQAPSPELLFHPEHQICCAAREIFAVVPSALYLCRQPTSATSPSQRQLPYHPCYCSQGRQPSPSLPPPSSQLRAEVHQPPLIEWRP